MLPKCFAFSLLFLLLPFQISPWGLIKHLWWLGVQGGGKGLPVGWPLMIPTGWRVKEGCGTGEKHPKLDPDAGPWCLLDSGAPAQLCFHICDFPPSPSESKHSSCSWHILTSRERKEPPWASALCSFSRRRARQVSSAPFLTHNSCQRAGTARPHARVTSRHLCPHL